MNSTSPTSRNPLADTHANYTAAVLEGKAAGLIPTAVDIPPTLPDYRGLSSPARARMKTEPNLNAPMNITQAALDKVIEDLAQGDAKAGAALRMMAVMAPAYGDFDPNGAPSVFELVRQSGLVGQDIGDFYAMCDSHPIKALGVLYAKERIDFAALGCGKNFSLLKDMYSVNSLLNRVESSLLAKYVLEGGTRPQGLAHPLPEALRSTTLLTAEDTPRTAVVKLGQGDERAERTLAMIAGMAEIVDRNAITGSMAPLMTLDSLGITGEKVIAFHEACGSPFATVAVLRACQLGFVSDQQLQKVASAKPGANVGGADVGDLDVKDLIVQVTEALPNFSYPAALMGGRQPGDLPPAGSGASGKPVPSVPMKKNLVQPPQPGQEKGGVADS